MTLAVPRPDAFVENGVLTQAGQAFFERVKTAVLNGDFESVSTLSDTATLAEMITAHNALVGILKG